MIIRASEKTVTASIQRSLKHCFDTIYFNSFFTITKLFSEKIYLISVYLATVSIPTSRVLLRSPYFKCCRESKSKGCNKENKRRSDISFVLKIDVRLHLTLLSSYLLFKWIKICTKEARESIKVTSLTNSCYR